MNFPEFNDKQLYERVFTHRSYLNESRGQIKSNERLEFLGDSILSFVVSSHIFKKYPEFKEGELTNLRSIMTNTETLSEIGRKMELGKYLKLSRGEESGGGRNNKSILANTYEALLGGIFLDQGLEAAREFVTETILNHEDEIVEDQGLKDPKSYLQEVVQERFKVSPTYSILKEEGPDHDRTYTVGVAVGEQDLGTGVGHSKQEAEKNSARAALQKLK